MTDSQHAIRRLQIETERLSERIDLYVTLAQRVQPGNPTQYEFLLNRIDVTMREYQDKMIRLAELLDREAQP